MAVSMVVKATTIKDVHFSLDTEKQPEHVEPSWWSRQASPLVNQGLQVWYLLLSPSDKTQPCFHLHMTPKMVDIKFQNKQQIVCQQTEA